MRARTIVAAFLAMLLVAIGVSAQETDLAFRYSLKGGPSPSNKYTILSLNLDEGSARAILLYSEPSHTLIGSYLDNTNGDPETQSWYPGLLPARATQMHAGLSAGVKGTLTQGRRPVDRDTHLVLHTLIERNGSVIDDTFKINTNVQNFHFEIALAFPKTRGGNGARSIEPNFPGGVPGTHTFRCIFGDGGSCGTSTVTCTENSATCCLKTDPASGCGWCGKAVAVCGDGPCSSCQGV